MVGSVVFHDGFGLEKFHKKASVEYSSAPRETDKCQISSILCASDHERGVQSFPMVKKSFSTDIVILQCYFEFFIILNTLMLFRLTGRHYQILLPWSRVKGPLR